jgi:hypothetical protein
MKEVLVAAGVFVATLSVVIGLTFLGYAINEYFLIGE